MSNEIDPLVSLGKIDFFGNPHHGLCRNGTLTKTDGSTMTYPQPISGDTQLVKFSDTPVISRSAEEVVSDAAKHYEWLDHALIGGSDLYGKNIGTTWIHKSDGRTWAINTIYNSGFNVNIRYILFGVVGIGEELDKANSDEYSLNLSLAGTGLPDIAIISVMSVKTDGTEALVKIYASTNEWALGKITLSGDINPHNGEGLAAIFSVETHHDDVITSDEDATPWDGWWEPVWITASQTGTWTDLCGTAGREIYTVTLTLGGEIPGEHPWSWSWPQMNSENWNRIYNKDIEIIFWKWFDENGIIQELIVKKHNLYEDIKDTVFIATSSDIESKFGCVYDVGVVYTNTGTAEISIRSTETQRETTTYSILVDGVVVSESELIYEFIRPILHEGVFWYDPITSTIVYGSYYYQQETHTIESTDWTLTLDGTEIDSGDINDMPDEIPSYRYNVAESFTTTLYPNTHADIMPKFETIFQSINVICARVHDVDDFGAAPYHYRECITPHGSDGVTMSESFAASKASYHPVTFDLLRNETDNVCYI